MARKYDSTRREEAAKKTRQAIVEAAFELHGLGIIEYEAVAEKANVSLATVRKHFPTREALFEGCTSWGAHNAPFPDLALLRSTEDPAELLRLCVSQTFALYESLFGQMWTGLTYVRESVVLQRVTSDLTSLVDQLADLVMERWPELPAPAAEARGYLRGLISFLTYRALRHDGGLSPEQTTERITEALLRYFEGLESSTCRKEAARA